MWENPSTVKQCSNLFFNIALLLHWLGVLFLSSADSSFRLGEVHFFSNNSGLEHKILYFFFLLLYEFRDF